ncbi:MAG: leucyl aminopeptidase [candidate division WOR-3 bacterium]
MKIELVARKHWTGKVLAVFAYEDGKPPLGLEKSEAESIAAGCTAQNFKGAYKKTALVSAEDRLFVVTGLGKRKDFELDRARVASAKALKLAEDKGVESLGLLIPDNKDVRGDLAEFASAAIEGAVLGSYRFDKYKKPKEDDTKPVAGLTCVFANTKNLSAAMRRSCAKAEVLCAAVSFTRDLGNEPSVVKPPEKLAQIAEGLAQEGRINVKVMHKPELKKLGMNGILAVGAGSHNHPCLVRLTYTPKVRPKKTICLVGKGITFDSGGISIKPSQGMEAMKDDMAGAASVLGIFHYLGKVDIPVLVHGLVPLAENMPGGGAQRPGDIIRHYGGKTSEVISTDAEGRLILADALAYGSELKPNLMIDIATLTGACVVALGDEYSALLGTDDDTIRKLISLGLKQGEFFWQLPLPERYKSHIKSNVADMKNVGKPQNAGTIAGGLFLKEFVAEGVPWVHIDIAGPAYTKDGWDYAPAGATGVPVRTIAALLHSM